jgi:DtxR family Mn-dependent transcriptional regulator
METELSKEAEEYIEMIYKLQKQNGMAKTKELSEIMHVVPGSVTNTIEHLESHGLITHVPYRGAKLTLEGEKIALGIIRKHRLAERMLTDLLKADWCTVHQDACKLEHALTKNLATLLEKRLGYPRSCPHGNPIPSEDGMIREQPCLPLSNVEFGKEYIVDKIIDEEHVNLKLLAKKRIMPEAKISLIGRDSRQVSVIIEKRKHELNTDLAESIFVRKIKREEKKCS